MVAGSDMTQKLGELRTKLHDYELKAKQIPHIKKEIEELEAEIDAQNFHNPSSAKGSPKRDLPAAPMPAMVQPPEVLEVEEGKKRMRNINKKLDQIKKLKEKDGGDLDADAIAKINGEKELLKELECIKNGEGYAAPEGVDVSFKALPNDPAEMEKRIKALKKKLQQIDALKAKGGKVDAEAKAKLDSEHLVKQELAALEQGETTVAFQEPSLDEIAAKFQLEKSDLERRHKATKKKLTAIEKLKAQAPDSLDADGKAKLATATDLGKELSAIEKGLSDVNKKERERVAARVG